MPRERRECHLELNARAFSPFFTAYGLESPGAWCLSWRREGAGGPPDTRCSRGNGAPFFAAPGASRRAGVRTLNPRGHQTGRQFKAALSYICGAWFRNLRKRVPDMAVVAAKVLKAHRALKNLVENGAQFHAAPGASHRALKEENAALNCWILLYSRSSTFPRSRVGTLPTLREITRHFQNSAPRVPCRHDGCAVKVRVWEV